MLISEEWAMLIATLKRKKNGSADKFINDKKPRCSRVSPRRPATNAGAKDRKQQKGRGRNKRADPRPDESLHERRIIENDFLYRECYGKKKRGKYDQEKTFMRQKRLFHISAAIRDQEAAADKKCYRRQLLRIRRHAEKKKG